MDLPSDLSEGWWWCRTTDGLIERLEIAEVWKDDGHNRRGWMIGNRYVYADVLADRLGEFSAMERVAPPSWEKEKQG